MLARSNIAIAHHVVVKNLTSNRDMSFGLCCAGDAGNVGVNASLALSSHRRVTLHDQLYGISHRQIPAECACLRALIEYWGTTVMKKLLTLTIMLAASFAIHHSAIADDRDNDRGRGNDKMTIAVFGDWPYNQNLLANAAF